MPFSHIPAPLRPWVLPCLSVFAVVALFLASLSIIRVGELQQAKEQERIAADVAACERGNVLRLALTEFLAPFVPGPTGPVTERSEALRKFKEAVKPVDCDMVTVGTTENKENGE